ncbi:MAG: hypothetical protein PF689_03360, partial [Deltaproteobacteria bacterium]|nr:hypothetical protein [Deltaproteobacteria bacterium]
QDCEDPDCADSCIEICNDGNDNDANGLIDCADPACACAADCTPPAEETNCSDGIDNNCDGFVDCEDQFCIGNQACKCIIVNIFWDSTGYIECEDPDVCSYYYDGVNNYTDCMDLDSSNRGYYEVCDQATDICPKGSICTRNIGDAENNNTCVPLCQKETHPSCPDDGNGKVGVCLGNNFNNTGLGSCVLPDNCDLLNPYSCEYRACYIMSVEPVNSNLLTICHQEGNKAIWEHCIQGNFECIDGSQCLATHLGYRCAPFCYDEMDCNDQTCHKMGNNNFGYCF